MIICGLMSPWCWHVMHGSSWYDSHLWIWIVHLIWLMHLSISTAESNLFFQKDPFSCIQTRVTIFIRTICLRSSYPFYIVSYYKKWARICWTDSMYGFRIMIMICLMNALAYWESSPIDYILKNWLPRSSMIRI